MLSSSATSPSAAPNAGVLWQSPLRSEATIRSDITVDSGAAAFYLGGCCHVGDSRKLPWHVWLRLASGHGSRRAGQCRGGCKGLHSRLPRHGQLVPQRCILRDQPSHHTCMVLLHLSLLKHKPCMRS